MDLFIVSDIKKDTKNISTFKNIFNLSNIENKITEVDYSDNIVINIGYVLCKSKVKSRILICTENKIHEQDYFKLLNCAFTAKRYDIRIDCLSTTNNPILRQCSIITKGLYITNTLKGLINLLGNKQSQSVMSFNIKCVCHNQDVLVGLTCPVCLGVYCKFIPVCKRCKTKFNFTR
ncbi:general transcription factor IIH subunit 3 (TF2H3) [Vairimorpha necatrix]|uniref:General transcription and DNA repair factor IIH subunit TFB4 n=1 Tax=Vairimorpha necatrix TaxID=6039 RepID=A0AAX4JAZ8_9MICR